MFVSLFLLWAGLLFPLSGQEAIVGLVLSFSIALLFFSRMEDRSPIKFSGFPHLLKFLASFCVELVKANYAVAKIVLTPSLPISPKLVRVDTTIQSKTARAVLANAITLTPGTLTVDMIGNELYIHVVDGNSIEQPGAILAPFETDLKGGFDR